MIINPIGCWNIASLFFLLDAIFPDCIHTQSLLLILRAVYPGSLSDRMMPSIKAFLHDKKNYFGRSRVAFLKVGYLLSVEILTSLVKICSYRSHLNSKHGSILHYCTQDILYTTFFHYIKGLVKSAYIFNEHQLQLTRATQHELRFYEVLMKLKWGERC